MIRHAQKGADRRVASDVAGIHHHEVEATPGIVEKARRGAARQAPRGAIPLAKLHVGDVRRGIVVDRIADRAFSGQHVHQAGLALGHHGTGGVDEEHVVAALEGGARQKLRGLDAGRRVVLG